MSVTCTPAPPQRRRYFAAAAPATPIGSAMASWTSERRRIRDLITTNLNAAPNVTALNERAYARYRRHGVAFDDKNFKMDLSNGVLIYMAIKGARADVGGRGGRGGGGGDDYMTRQPNITIFFGSTEAPDETAYGDWMTLVATMGLQWDKALLQSLLEGTHVVDRKASSFFGGVSLSWDRPPAPERDEGRPDPGQGGSGRRDAPVDGGKPR